MKRIITIIALIGLFNMTASAQLNNIENSRKIATKGYAEKEITPDIIYLAIGLKEYYADGNSKKKVAIEKLEKQLFDAAMAAEYVDILQIPAFLVRQTDLVVAAAKTGKTVNLKKGQFMSPEAMKHAVQKMLDSNNDNVMVTDRGTMFGYQDMIVDFRGIPTMQQYATTVLDITHSLQQPNQASGVTGGRPDLIETVAKAGIAVGVDGIFIETHFDPANAKSDGANMLHLDYFEDLMKKLVAIRQTVKNF